MSKELHILQDSLKNAARVLNGAGVENPWREARLLAAYTLGKTYEQIFANPDWAVTPEQVEVFDGVVQRRVNREPLAKITQSKEFWGLNFKTTHDTLDPRPDSETILEAVLEEFPDKEKPYRILDLGTGTGCLLLSLLSEYPNATGVGVDLSEQACQVACHNMKQLKLEKRADIICASWFDAANATFDIIVSNPPYIDLKEDLPPEVADYDPPLALYASNNGLRSYEKIIGQIRNFMNCKTGKAFLEFGFKQPLEINKILLKNNFIIQKMHSDLAGNARIAVFA